MQHRGDVDNTKGVMTDLQTHCHGAGSGVDGHNGSQEDPPVPGGSAPDHRLVLRSLQEAAGQAQVVLVLPSSKDLWQSPRSITTALLILECNKGGTDVLHTLRISPNGGL